MLADESGRGPFHRGRVERGVREEVAVGPERDVVAGVPVVGDGGRPGEPDVALERAVQHLADPLGVVGRQRADLGAGVDAAVGPAREPEAGPVRVLEDLRPVAGPDQFALDRPLAGLALGPGKAGPPPAEPERDPHLRTRRRTRRHVDRRDWPVYVRRGVMRPAG